MIEMIFLIALPIGFALAARRFERRRQREGTWNESGPIDPTYAEPNPTLRAAGIDLPRIERESPPKDRPLPESERPGK